MQPRPSDLTGSYPISMGSGGGGGGGGGGGSRTHGVPKVAKAVKSKSNSSGRTYTSKFRGVHQTFPTKRWEAQFRRNGKPTSLGKPLPCFHPGSIVK